MKVLAQRIRVSDESLELIRAGTNEILSSGVLTMGRYTRQFEDSFSSFTGAAFAVACNSGTSALELILRALEIEGRSVIVPTNTFLATALAVLHSGNKVIFADSDPHTLCLDLNDVKRRLASDTAAVILVHIGGIISPAVYELQRWCRERGLWLIEDCAHAHGSTLDGRHAGTFGAAGAFSFFPTKVFTTGEGGIITTHDEDLALRIRRLRNHGKNPELHNRISEPGFNYRISEFTALLGVQQLSVAEETVCARRKVASLYDARLADLSLLHPLVPPQGLRSTYYKYIVYLDEAIERDRLKATMKDQFEVALPSEVYAELCHTEPLWRNYTYCGRRRVKGDVACHRWPACGCDRLQDGFPGAEYISGRHICLPIYPGLTEAEADHVASSLRRSVDQSLRSYRCAS